jgi:hypothetical protein
MSLIPYSKHVNFLRLYHKETEKSSQTRVEVKKTKKAYVFPIFTRIKERVNGLKRLLKIVKKEKNGKGERKNERSEDAIFVSHAKIFVRVRGDFVRMGCMRWRIGVCVWENCFGLMARRY